MITRKELGAGEGGGGRKEGRRRGKEGEGGRKGGRGEGRGGEGGRGGGDSAVGSLCREPNDYKKQETLILMSLPGSLLLVFFVSWLRYDRKPNIQVALFMLGDVLWATFCWFSPKKDENALGHTGVHPTPCVRALRMPGAPLIRLRLQ